MVAPDNDTAAQLSEIKSFTSVNSCALAQSTIGGWLLDNQLSLKAHCQQMNQCYQAQSEAMVEALNEHFYHDEGYHWQAPEGGFFQVLQLPFDIEPQDLYLAADKDQVIYMPLMFFAHQQQRWRNQVRLAFSYYDKSTIFEGIRRLKAHFDRLAPHKK